MTGASVLEAARSTVRQKEFVLMKRFSARILDYTFIQMKVGKVFRDKGGGGLFVCLFLPQWCCFFRNATDQHCRMRTSAFCVEEEKEEGGRKS